MLQVRCMAQQVHIPPQFETLLQVQHVMPQMVPAAHLGHVVPQPCTLDAAVLSEATASICCSVVASNARDGIPDAGPMCGDTGCLWLINVRPEYTIDDG